MLRERLSVSINSSVLKIVIQLNVVSYLAFCRQLQPQCLRLRPPQQPPLPQVQQLQPQGPLLPQPPPQLRLHPREFQSQYSIAIHFVEAQKLKMDSMENVAAQIIATVEEMRTRI